MLRRVLACFILACIAAGAAPAAVLAQGRVALVVGESGYASGALPTTANDAGLVAQELGNAGFDLVQGADLDLAGLRNSVREFLDKVEAGGQGTVALVYFGGQGVQFEGENYLVPVGARIERASDIPMEAFRVADLVRSLAALPAGPRIVMLDAARPFPALRDGQPLAPGLALVDPPEGFAVSYSASPDALVEDGQGPYGPYASAFVEMMRQPGLDLTDLFGRLRVRVHELTQGRQTPWSAVKVTEPFAFLAPQENAALPPPLPARPSAPLADIGPEQAYALALERDTIQSYQDFLRAYPDSPQAARVKRLIAQRREALAWQRSVARDTPNAYWTYLKRYPRGPHAADARRRLARLSAPLDPPGVFDEVEYDIPPPLPGVEIIDRDDLYVPYYNDLPPPPPPPAYLLPPPPQEVYVLPPPPPPQPGYLPVPVPVPLPVWVRPPRPPRPPIIVPGRPIVDTRPGRPWFGQPPRDGLPPQRDGLPPQRDGLPPQRDGLMPPRDGKLPPRDGLPPPRDGRLPPRDGLPPPRDGQMPPRDGKLPPNWQRPAQDGQRPARPLPGQIAPPNGPDGQVPQTRPVPGQARPLPGQIAPRPALPDQPGTPGGGAQDRRRDEILRRQQEQQDRLQRQQQQQQEQLQRQQQQKQEKLQRLQQQREQQQRDLIDRQRRQQQDNQQEQLRRQQMRQQQDNQREQMQRAQQQREQMMRQQQDRQREQMQRVQQQREQQMRQQQDRQREQMQRVQQQREQMMRQQQDRQRQQMQQIQQQQERQRQQQQRHPGRPCGQPGQPRCD